MNLGHDFDYDVIVLGTGLLAAHLTQDASERGLKTLWLAESDLVNPGLSAFPRLLQPSFPLSPFSSRYQATFYDEVELLRFRASHLVRRQPLLLPLAPSMDAKWYQRLYHRAVKVRVAQAQQRRYLRNQGSSSIDSMVLRDEEVQSDWPVEAQSTRRLLSHWETTVNEQRWCLTSATSAREAGAKIKTYAALEEWVLTASGKVRGVKVRHKETGKLERFTGYVVINAMDQLPANLDETLKWNRNIRFRREVHLLLDVSSDLGWQEDCEGVVFSAIPHGSNLLVSMQDSSLFHHPDLIQVTKEDVLRIMDWCAQYLSHLGVARMLSSQASFQPLFLSPTKGKTKKETFTLFQHKNTTPSGLISAMANDSIFVRKCAEETIDKACKILKRRLFSTTKKTTFQKASSEDVDLERLYEQYKLPKPTMTALFQRHGGHLPELLHTSQATKGGMMELCDSSKTTVGEIRFMLEKEWIQFPEDLLRRAGVGLGSCLGTDCIVPMARLFCEVHEDKQLSQVIEQLQSALHSFTSPISYQTTLQQLTLHR